MDIREQITREWMELAEKLHRENPVVNTHLDLAAEIMYRYDGGEKEVIKNHFLDSFKRGGYNLIVSSIYIENKMLPDLGLQTALKQIRVLLEDMETVAEDVILVKTKQDLDRAVAENKIGIMIYMEGLDCIGTDAGLLRILYELGARGASLTWSRRNYLATGCCKANERKQIPGGISVHGKEAIAKMESLGMFIDISHLNDEGFEQIQSMRQQGLITKPYIATHSNAQSIYFNYRNLTDEQMEALAGQGGIMGVNGCSCIAGSMEKGNHLEMLCRHMEYETEKIGADHVGYGFDLCDSYYLAQPHYANSVYESDDCLKDHGDVIMLTAALLQRGMDLEAVKKIIGGNYYRYFREVLPE